MRDTVFPGAGGQWEGRDSQLLGTAGHVISGNIRQHVIAVHTLSALLTPALIRRYFREWR